MVKELFRWSLISVAAAVLLIILMIVVASNRPPESPQQRAERRAALKKRIDARPIDPSTKAANALRSEPKIVEVYFNATRPVSWTVGVINDGMSRNGYASFVCEVIRENGALMRNTRVRLVDIERVRRGETPGKYVSLGSMDCNTYQSFD